MNARSLFHHLTDTTRAIHNSALRSGPAAEECRPHVRKAFSDRLFVTLYHDLLTRLLRVELFARPAEGVVAQTLAVQGVRRGPGA